jgi:hypothetical protein
MNIQQKEILHMAGFEAEWSIKFSRFIHENNIDGLYEEFNKAHNHISANGYAKIVLTDMCLNIVKLLVKK